MVAHPTVRKVVESDLAGIFALYRELRPHDPVLAPTVAREALTSVLSQSNVHLMVCEVGSTLVATCMLAVIPNIASGARPFGVIEHVVTLASHRKRGYARLVLERALAEAWSLGCYKVMLLSGARREAAHKLYESVGFVADIERGFVVKPEGSRTGGHDTFVYAQSILRLLIIASLLLVAMNRRFALYGMWFAISALVATHYWALFFELPFRFLDGRHPLSYLKGFILPTVITLLFMSLNNNRKPGKDAGARVVGSTANEHRARSQQ